MGAMHAATLLLAIKLAAPLQSGGSVAVITDRRIPVLREAAESARAALGDTARLYDLSETPPKVVQERLVSDEPDAVIATGEPAVRVAIGAPARTAVVLVLVPNAQAVAEAFAPRLVRGISLQVPPEAVLATLHRLAPQAYALWVIYSERLSGNAVERFGVAGATSGFSFEKSPVSDATSAARALGSPPAQVDAFVLLGDPVVRNAAFDQALLRLAFGRGFPIIGASRNDVQVGALFAFQLDAGALGREAAELARSPGKSPAIVAPTGYRLILNLATARNLGLTVPDDVRSAAAEVFGR